MRSHHASNTYLLYSVK